MEIYITCVIQGSTPGSIKGVHSFSIQFQQSNVFLPHQVKCSPITNQRKPYGHFLFIFLIQHLNLFYVKERAHPLPTPHTRSET